MEKVIIVSEENHSAIFVATSHEAAKRALIDTEWVDMYSSIWIYNEEEENRGHWEELINLYGKNWQEAFMGFNAEQMENMGFYFREVEVYN